MSYFSMNMDSGGTLHNSTFNTKCYYFMLNQQRFNMVNQERVSLSPQFPSNFNCLNALCTYGGKHNRYTGGLEFISNKNKRKKNLNFLKIR